MTNSSPSGPVLHYTFDDDDGTNVWDSSGNGNHGYRVGTFVYEDSFAGKAPRFTSRSTYIVSDSTNLNVNGWDELTVSTWIYITSDRTRNRIINRGKLTEEVYSGYGMQAGGKLWKSTWYAPGSFAGIIANGTSESIRPATFEVDVTPDPQLRRWYHMVGVWDATHVRVYVDGVLDAELEREHPGVPLYDVPGTKMVIGNFAESRRKDWVDYYFDGQIDEVRVYNRALTAPDVVALHAESMKAPPQLLLHYTFDDYDGASIVDQSGAGNHGAVHGPTQVAHGIDDAAYSFDGTDDYIDSGTILSGLTSFTFSAWVKIRSFVDTYPGAAHGYMGICGQQPDYYVTPGTGHPSRWMFYTSDNSFGTSGSWEDGSGWDSRVPHILPTNEWRLVTQTYDGRYVRQYDNGVLVNEKEYIGKTLGSTNAFLIGKTFAYPWRLETAVFDGLIDDLRIYDGSLSSNAVAALHAEHASSFPEASELILHYTFDADDGTNVFDQSGNGFDGRVVGNVTYENAPQGKAPHFSNSASYIVCDAEEMNISGWTGITISTWVNVARWTTYGSVIVRSDAFASSLGHNANLSVGSGSSVYNGGFRCRTNQNTNIKVYSTKFGAATGDAVLGRWYHICGTYDGTNMRYYVDGVLDAEEAVDRPDSLLWDHPGSSLMIGKGGGTRYNWRDDWLNGLVDEVRIYNYALSADEVLALSGVQTPTNVSVTVTGSPADYGTSQPYGYGTHSVAVGTMAAETVVSPAHGIAGARYTCTGWAGSGSVPESGTSNSVIFTVTTNSTLTWRWLTEYPLDIHSGSGGTVVGTDGWYTDGTALTISAVPEAGYAFGGWGGDVAASNALDNPLNVIMDQGRSIEASFDQLVPWPAGGIELTVRRPKFIWSAPPGATWFHIWINRNGATYYNKWVSPDDNTWIPDFDMRGGDFEWWVRPWGPDTGLGAWSSGSTFSISNMVPGKTELVAPSGVVSTNAPMFTWNAVQHATAYRLWISRNSVAYHSCWVTGATSFTPTEPLTYGEYDWWVQAASPDGAGPWSDGMAFSYGVPEPLSPTNSVYGTRRPGFVWSPVDGAVWYQIIVERDGVSDRSQWVQATESYVFPADFLYGRYTWQVRAWSPSGKTGPRSAAAGFDIGLAVPLSASSERLRWDDRGSTDATWYQIWIQDSAGNTVRNVWVEQVETIAAASERQYRILPPLPVGAYLAWIKSWRPGDGSGTWSRAHGFTVSPTAGSFTGLKLAPQGGSQPMELVWDGEAGEVYDLQWSTNLAEGFTVLRSNITCTSAQSVFSITSDLPASCFFRLSQPK